MMEQGLVSPLALNTSSLCVGPVDGLLREIKPLLVLADGDGFVRHNVYVMLRASEKRTLNLICCQLL